jgi:hypothetical protein
MPNITSPAGVISDHGIISTTDSKIINKSAAVGKKTPLVEQPIPSTREEILPPHASSSSSTTTKASLDFVTTSSAVKDLFGLPYQTDDRSISVAIHNIGGMLLMDTAEPATDDDDDNDAAATVQESRCKNNQLNQEMGCLHEDPQTSHQRKSDDKDDHHDHDETIMTRSLVTLSNLETSQLQNSEALAIVNTIIETNLHKSGSHAPYQQQQQNENHASIIPPSPVPREYLNWKFHDMNLLVGSDALIYRTPEASLTVRVEDAAHLQNQLAVYQSQKQRLLMMQNHQQQAEQPKKLSYADAVSVSNQNTITPAESNITSPVDRHQNKIPAETTIFSSASNPEDLKTCIIPVPSEPVGSLLIPSTVSVDDKFGRVHGKIESEETYYSSSSPASSINPVSTVLDTYLDNIMANVPQLALCLREKGFIQSVKLLNTEEIPSRLMHKATLDTAIPFETVSAPGADDLSEDIFSPRIMEMNASALLRFLKTNCSKDNATYLLRREPGQANIQLYDISSISAQRQQKWIWWLVSISYRFANRLRHLSRNLETTDQKQNKSLRRTFRVRQRALLENTLELLDLLADISGNQHESFIAAIRENLADTFLDSGGVGCEEDECCSDLGADFQATKVASPIVPPPVAVVSSSQQQPYANVSVDALTKAQDHLTSGIKSLNSVLKSEVNDANKLLERRRRRWERHTLRLRERHLASSVEKFEDIDDSNTSRPDDECRSSDIQGDLLRRADRMDPVVTQQFGLHYKLVNVSLRLADIHLRNYWSSSAMQNLRTAAHLISDLLYLIDLVGYGDNWDANGWLPKIQIQYIWLWEQCGHFARSFAGDILWRDRGHASGDDVVTTLQDVASAFDNYESIKNDRVFPVVFEFVQTSNPLVTKSKNMMNLHSLSGIVDFHKPLAAHVKIKAKDNEALSNEAGISAAKERLEQQKLLQRDERRVLVAAAFAYSQAIHSLEAFLPQEQFSIDQSIRNLLRQRLGDACNETGKALLHELRALLESLPTLNSNGNMHAATARALISSAEFWFLEGLDSFHKCGDIRNIALLRCNLCQCYKLRANSLLSECDAGISSHSEICLQEAANHLHAAHEALETRDLDPATWDMVSGELAATYLVLGVRRRQSLIGLGNNQLIMHTLRLSPGMERSIVEPMERAVKIYEEMRNYNQNAAAHYQLAMLYSRIWTCQRDEAKTREKLSLAFQHFHAAYSYFAANAIGNEITFCLLSLDLANLYTSVSGIESSSKALLICLHTGRAFSCAVVEEKLGDLQKRKEWFEQMKTIAKTIEERVLALLKSLVKLEKPGDKEFKSLYRVGLMAMMPSDSLNHSLPTAGDESIDLTAAHLLSLNRVLTAITKLQEEQKDKK